MTSLPQQDKKCPDCGGLPGLYPNNQCPVCYVKAQHDPSLNPQVDSHLNNELIEVLLRFASSAVDEMGVQQGAIDENKRLFTLEKATQAILNIINQEKAKLVASIRLAVRGEDPDQYRPNDLIALGYVEEILDDIL